MHSRKVGLTASFLLLAAGGMAACDSDENPNEDGHFYCVDANNQVVDEDICDDSDGSSSNGFFFMYLGSSMHTPSGGYSTYPVGSRLPANAPKFSVNDTKARQKFGLPATGRVANGTVKTNVVGKGGAGSAVKAPSGGG